MSQYEEYTMGEVDDDMSFHGRVMAESETDDDEYDNLDNKITDTSAADARRGKDIQGIPWERLKITREQYRKTRLEQYKNYENVPQSGERSEKIGLQTNEERWKLLQILEKHKICEINHSSFSIEELGLVNN